MKKFIFGIASLAVSSTLFAMPHFYLQMDNRSDKDATLRFQKGSGNVFLEPEITPNTDIKSHQLSTKYEVHIEPLEPTATFNIIFKGKADCNFNIGYYEPGNPKVTVSGSGCYGGGYAITDNGYTLLLYITDIHKK